MNVKLKSISRAGIPEAMSKAELYRNLNEPGEAESICLDVLAFDPDNADALRLLGLAITDRFAGGAADRHAEAESIFQKLKDPYERLYYTGIVHERRAKALLRAGARPHAVVVLFEEAMTCFEHAEKIRPAGNDDAILRWNRCVRLLQQHAPEAGDEAEVFEPSDSPPYLP
jgi:tetratricopeptide (TPR) repeat protein